MIAARIEGFRDEVVREIDPAYAFGGVDFLRQRRAFRAGRRREVLRRIGEDRPARQEFQGMRVRGGFGLDEHGLG
jgi:hypothetical protein